MSLDIAVTTIATLTAVALGGWLSIGGQERAGNEITLDSGVIFALPLSAASLPHTASTWPSPWGQQHRFGRSRILDS